MKKILALFIGLFLINGVFAQIEDDAGALPDKALSYRWKIATEKVKMLFTFDKDKKQLYRLELLEKREKEFKKLIETNRTRFIKDIEYERKNLIYQIDRGINTTKKIEVRQKVLERLQHHTDVLNNITINRQENNKDFDGLRNAINQSSKVIDRMRRYS